MSESMRLTDAIKATENGIKSLNSQISYQEAVLRSTQKKLEEMTNERSARMKMLQGMKELQKTFPEDQTLKFVIPRDYER